jgi:hypothetical protein
MSANIILCILLCVFCMCKTVSYSYSLIDANISVWLSGAAYCTKDKYASMKLSGPASRFIVTNTLYDKTTDLQGFTGVLPSQKTIYIVFRGSSSLLNWIDDLKIKRIAYTSYPRCNCTVHDGFYTTTQRLYSQVLLDVRLLQKKYKYNNIILTGHSLGAAIAHLMMLELKRVDIFSTVYNFGQPRIGDLEYANFVSFYNRDRIYRYTHYKDIVPHIPPNSFDYYHTCGEIYEDETGKLKNCSTYYCEDPTCSMQFLLRDTNTEDHSTYLGHYLSCETSTFPSE